MFYKVRESDDSVVCQMVDHDEVEIEVFTVSYEGLGFSVQTDPEKVNETLHDIEGEFSESFSEWLDH